jgi:hypothetical protein
MQQNNLYLHKTLPVMSRSISSFTVFVLLLLSTQSFSQTNESNFNCEKKWKHIDFLKANNLISTERLSIKINRLQAHCPNSKYTQETSPTNAKQKPSQTVTEQYNQIVSLGLDSKNFLISGSCFLVAGTTLIVVSDRVSFKSVKEKNAVMGTGFGILGIGSILSITGIAERLIYSNKKNQLTIQLLANKELGTKITF